MRLERSSMSFFCHLTFSQESRIVKLFYSYLLSMNSSTKIPESLEGEKVLQTASPKSPEVAEILARFEEAIIDVLADGWDALTPEEKDAKRRNLLWYADVSLESIAHAPSEAIQKFLAA